jgi:hypothetical protein
MTPAAPEVAEERLRDELVARGWSFMGSVGKHHYWRSPGGGWRTER